MLAVRGAGGLAQEGPVHRRIQTEVPNPKAGDQLFHAERLATSIAVQPDGPQQPALVGRNDVHAA